MLRPLMRTTLLCVATALAGCSSARSTDVLEARLRSQEDMLAQYESEVTRVKTELGAARRETEDLRVQLAQTGQPVVPAEESGAAFRAAGIQFSSLMTGGMDVDGQAGHDGLTVVLVPHDPQGELVKLPGTIEIEAFDLSLPGGAQRIGHWTFAQRDIHQYWHKGVIQSGYQFELPWQTPPTSDQILVHGFLSTANGRQFDTTLTVKVDPPGGNFQGPPEQAIQQASATDENPFATQPATQLVSAQQPADSPEASAIIWADGEAPAGQAPAVRPATAMQTDQFSRETDTQPASSGPSPFDTSRGSTARRPSPGKTLTGTEFSRGLDLGKPLSVQPAPPRPRPLTQRLTPGKAPVDTSQELPPTIEDWWSKEDRASVNASQDRPGIQTSDSFTDETIPRYR